MGRIGIMQGRLGPPEGGRFQAFPCEGWRQEFPRAAEACLDSIEWIYDAFGEAANAIGSEAGIAEIEELSTRHAVAVASVCADYFMDRPIPRANASDLHDIVSRLQWLVKRCARLRIERLVLPFVDASRMRDAADRERVIGVLQDLVPIADGAKVEIHLETDLGPEGFASFLGRVAHSTVKVNYDTGNSASLGYRPAEEFAAYGTRIGSVHVKDRVLGGGTVPLGSGSADFESVFRGLREVGYCGDYILQAARGEDGAEVVLASSNRRFIVDRMNKARVEAAGSP